MSTETITKIFDRSRGGVVEYHYGISVTDPMLSFEDQLTELMSAYKEAACGHAVLFRRFFLSDAANQQNALCQMLESVSPAPTSFVQQAPLNGTKIAVWIYCVSEGRLTEGSWTHEGRTHRWDGSIHSDEAGSEAQMSEIFKKYQTALEGDGMSVRDNCLRTWIFVRDIDLNYSGVVKGRVNFFDSIGLTKDTHYIASTGIGGRHFSSRNLVGMDAYAVSGLEDGQVRYLTAPDHLNPTSEYGVTFERGTSVTYGDRRHVFISGTASIDCHGSVMYVGDVLRQTRRMVENVSALLAAAEASISDVMMSVVYLRDGSDYEAVKLALADLCPTLQPVFVLAPVCRPAWLVEMECIAITPKGDNKFRKY